MKQQSKTTRGMIWKTLENVLTQGMQFIIQLVLARILIPEDFGVIGILNVFTNLANTLVNNGLSSALLRQKEYDAKAYATVFVVSLSISVAGYGLIFAAAPAIAGFYENTALTAYLRVYTITILVTAITSMTTTVLRYKMDFRSIFVGNFLGVLAQGICGVIMAVNGFGVWSLIYAHLARFAVPAVVLLVFAKWRPQFFFSLRILKSLFSYSWKLAVGWIIGTLYSDVFSLIIGKRFSTQTLGYYTKGNSIPSMINRVLSQSVTAVMFPSLAKDQHDLQIMKTRTRTMLSMASALVLPVMAGVAACATPLVIVLLTEKWLPAAPIIQISCIPMAINVVNNANMQSINAIGRSDVFLYSEAIKRTVTIILVLITSRIDFYLMLWSIAFMGLISMVVNLVADWKLLGYHVKEYLQDLLPYTAIALVLFAVVYAMNGLQVNVYLKLLLQLAVCAAIYFTSIFLLPLPAYRQTRKILRSVLDRKNK